MRRTTPAIPRRLRIHMAWLGCCGLVWGLTVGCDMPEHVRQTRETPVLDDVRAILATARPEPWINFDAANPGKVNGIAINVCLISASTRKGIFGPGIIRVIMKEDVSGRKVERADAPSQARRTTGETLHEWELTPPQAEAFRVMRRPDRRYVMGDGYGLRLSWGDKDLAGRRVAVIVEYDRTDGQIIRRKPFWLRIPTRR